MRLLLSQNCPKYCYIIVCKNVLQRVHRGVATCCRLRAGRQPEPRRNPYRQPECASGADVNIRLFDNPFSSGAISVPPWG